ncbi:FAD-binding oxidoreductase [Zhengella sp. ZM62]|uniref:FAD-binding oxidoreductase n=1 Tax=Zhengella sedimenti TaxID=3390035 RepID=UPI003975C0E3
MDFQELKRGLHGAAIEIFDPASRQACADLVWNGRKPDLVPRYVVRAETPGDVQKAVAFARANGLSVSPRGGGHNFTGIALKGDVIVDVSALDHLQIDVKTGTALAGPGVTNERLAAALSRHGLAFPVGHCATVPVSGYLLGGGVGWNSGAWGIACFSVTGVDVVLADGRLVHADEDNHSDILWAARGAGPEFFGVVTGYRLRLYEAPKAILSSVHVHAPADARAVGEWAEAAISRMPANLEFTVKVSSPPPEANAPQGAFVLAVIATAFGTSETDAGSILDELFADAPATALQRMDAMPTPFDALYQLTSVSTPKGKRYAVDTLWSDASFAMVLESIVSDFARRPSADSFALVALRSPQSQAPGDAAFSRIGRVFASIYTIWDREDADAANMAWLRQTMGAVEPAATGTYVGESDLEREGRPVSIHSPAAAARLAALRLRHDPEGRFRSLAGFARGRAAA